MARLESNRSGELEVFVRVVESGGFSAAARTYRMTPSAVSKLIARLEARLGARLINRSTRKLQLTPEGAALYERGVRILADLEEAERSAASGERVAGRVRINTSSAFATHILAPLMPEIVAAYPELALEIIQTDEVVDLLEQRADIAIRAGPLKSSSLIARKLGATAMTIVAAPPYLRRSGEPRTPQDLERHILLGFSYARAINGWPVLVDGGPFTIQTGARIQASDGEGLRQLTLAGAGLARLATFMVRRDIADGRLVPVLEAHNPGDREEFHAVYVGRGGPLPARVRVVLDILAEKGRVS